MLKFTPNGSAVKQLRGRLEKLSTQKEMAAEISVSLRTYRDIENKNLPIARGTFDRLAKALGVRPEQITLQEVKAAVPSVNNTATLLDLIGWNREQLIPRIDEEIVQATMDEGKLFEAARDAFDLDISVHTTLNDETGAYVEELSELLGGLTRSRLDYLKEVPIAEVLALRRRIRQLLVLLKGNDVWLYQSSIWRRLPERDTLPPPDEPIEHSSRLIAAFGPPGEYGETTMRVSVDLGQPFILPAFNEIVGKRNVAA